jgi:hypothetical protein
MTKEEKLDKIKKIITKLIDSNNTMEGQYNMPYSHSDDDYADWKVSFNVKRIAIWPKTSEVGCRYSGTIYITMLDIRVGFDGEWEKMKYISDLPSWVEDDITEQILENVNDFLPMVCVDITFD